MLLRIPAVLTESEAANWREALSAADWHDGGETAGHLSAGVKRNQQLHWQDPVGIRLGALIVERLERDPLFLSAALPQQILPPLFNRYEGGGHYGPHLDGAIRGVDGTRRRIRTDLSLTLALSEPADYDGGELVIVEAGGERSVKPAVGEAVLYASTSIHHVAPVTHGTRFAAFTWIQSLIRDAGQRALLLELDAAIQQLPPGERHRSDRLRFSNIYNNLLRRWADP